MSSISRLYDAKTMTADQAKRAVSRDHKSPAQKGKKVEPWRMNAYQRRSELQKLARYRMACHLAIGSDAAWATCIANVFQVINGQVTEAMVRDEWQAYGLPSISDAVCRDVVKHASVQLWRAPTLFSPAHTGSLLDVTSVEREAADIQKIDAVDELADDRRKRQDRERKAEKRAAKAALRPKHQSIAERAKELGVSRATLYRMIAAGKYPA